jgi:hypothetical protein
MQDKFIMKFLIAVRAQHGISTLEISFASREAPV